MVAVFTSTNTFPTSLVGAAAIMFGGITSENYGLIVDTMIVTQSMTGSYSSTAQATVGQSSGAGSMRLAGASNMGMVISASIAVIVSIWIILR